MRLLLTCCLERKVRLGKKMKSSEALALFFVLSTLISYAFCGANKNTGPPSPTLTPNKEQMLAPDEGVFGGDKWWE